MVKVLDEDSTAALQARVIIPADFVRVLARNRDTNVLEPCNLWSGVGNVTALVKDPREDEPISYAFYGFGGLLSISDIVATSNVSVQDVMAKMSHIDPLVDQMFRGYDCNKAEILMWRGLFSPATRNLVAPAFCRFMGFIDYIEVKEPSENEEGYVDFTCNSHTVELTRYNPDTRSHESQILRSETDNFLADAGTVAEREHFWGRFQGKVSTSGSKGSNSGSSNSPVRGRGASNPGGYSQSSGSS